MRYGGGNINNMKYRLYRKIATIQFKDIECDTEGDARKHYTDMEYDGLGNKMWKDISSGLIQEYIVTEDTNTENHNIFIERQLENERFERDFLISQTESKLQ